jgi:hypothetical protein
LGRQPGHKQQHRQHQVNAGIRGSDVESVAASLMQARELVPRSSASSNVRRQQAAHACFQTISSLTINKQAQHPHFTCALLLLRLLLLPLSTGLLRLPS